MRSTARAEHWRAGAVVALILAFFALTPHGASAGSRGIGVGIGVGTGLQILNELSKGGSARKSASKKKRNNAEEPPRASKTKKRPRDVEKSEPETASKNNDSDGSQKGADTPEGPAAGAQPAATTPAAAATATTAPAATAALPDSSGTSSNLISTPDEISSAQEHLRYLGYDVPATTGVLDLNTKIAIMKFQDSIGAQASGGLTFEQLRRLYVLSDERQKKGK